MKQSTDDQMVAAAFGHTIGCATGLGRGCDCGFAASVDAVHMELLDLRWKYARLVQELQQTIANLEDLKIRVGITKP